MNAPVDRATETSPLAHTAVAILGCGAVGRALAVEFAAQGAELQLWSRTRASAERALAAAHASSASARVLDSAREGAQAELVLITVADPVLESFVRSLADEFPRTEAAQVALHTNGTRGLDVMAPLAARGWGVGKLHPLVALPPGADSTPGRFAGSWFATLASERAASTVKRLVDALGARALALDPTAEQASVALHSAAALISGGLVALFDTAVRSASLGAESPDPTEALHALAASTLENLARSNPRDALTGPIARGAVAVVREQLELLDATEPDAALAYRVLGRRMLQLGVTRGTVSQEAQADLRALLE